MTAQLDHLAPQAGTPATDSDWDLDITIVEAGGVVDDLLRLTDDNCGQTCESACNSCP
ncbi:FxLD family lanthipeptide [Actinokineospora sp.]|uniref:FxLD family lanthipeptide n=1 Tax=Actinokineospora sp. TaxID=1872133 RepID=UPI004037C5F0